MPVTNPPAPDAMQNSQAPAIEGDGEDDTGPLTSGSPAAASWGGDGKINAVELMLRGSASLQAAKLGTKDVKTVAMPPMHEMLHAFDEMTGGAYAGSAGAEAMHLEGANAIYCAKAQDDGDNSGKLDPSRMWTSVYLADHGNATPRMAGMLRNVSMTFAGDPKYMGAAIQGFQKSEAYSPSPTSGGIGVPWERSLPGLAPLDANNKAQVAAQVSKFSTSVGDLVTARQGSNPPAFAAAGEPKDPDLAPSAIAGMRDVGKWLAADPRRGEMMLQQAFSGLVGRDGGSHVMTGPVNMDALDEEVAKAGSAVRKAWDITKSIVKTIRLGDPNDPETAKQIATGMEYLRRSEFKDVAPGLVLGLLSMQGRPEEMIDRIVAASELKAGNLPGYVWHSPAYGDVDIATQVATEGIAGAKGNVPASTVDGVKAAASDAIGAAKSAAGSAAAKVGELADKVVPPGKFAAANGMNAGGNGGPIVQAEAPAIAAAGEKGKPRGETSPPTSTDNGNGAFNSTKDTDAPGSPKPTSAQTEDLKRLVDDAYTNAKAQTRQERIQNGKIGPVLSAAIDLKTGKISKVWRNDPKGSPPIDLDPTLQKRLDTMPQSVRDAYSKSKGEGSHGEIFAVNELLKARPGAKLDEIAVYTINTSQKGYLGTVRPPCDHCAWMLNGVHYVK